MCSSKRVSKDYRKATIRIQKRYADYDWINFVALLPAPCERFSLQLLSHSNHLALPQPLNNHYGYRSEDNRNSRLLLLQLCCTATGAVAAACAATVLLLLLHLRVPPTTTATATGHYQHYLLLVRFDISYYHQSSMVKPKEHQEHSGDCKHEVGRAAAGATGTVVQRPQSRETPMTPLASAAQTKLLHIMLKMPH